MVWFSVKFLEELRGIDSYGDSWKLWLMEYSILHLFIINIILKPWDFFSIYVIPTSESNEYFSTFIMLGETCNTFFNFWKNLEDLFNSWWEIINLIYKKYNFDSWPRGFVLCGRHPWMEICSHKHLRETLSIYPWFNSLLGLTSWKCCCWTCASQRDPLWSTHTKMMTNHYIYQAFAKTVHVWLMEFQHYWRAAKYLALVRGLIFIKLSADIKCYSFCCRCLITKLPCLQNQEVWLVAVMYNHHYPLHHHLDFTQLLWEQQATGQIPHPCLVLKESQRLSTWAKVRLPWKSWEHKLGS